MRTPSFFICEHKDAEQLISAFFYCYNTDSTIPLLPNSEMSNLIFCSYTAWFVSALVGNPKNRFSHNEAHIEDGKVNSILTY